MFYLYILSALFAGISVVITRIFNAKIAEELGTIQGTYINYLTGLGGAFIFFIISKEYVNLSGTSYSNLPIYAYFGGAIGILVVVLSNYATPKVSSFSLSLLIFTGQLFIGIVIDFISYGDVSMGKIVGGILILLGLIYNIKVEKETINEEKIEVKKEVISEEIIN